MNEITIKIYEASTGEGYFYDIFEGDGTDEDAESLDGGLCTGTILDASQMAHEQLKDLLIRNLITK